MMTLKTPNALPIAALVLAGLCILGVGIAINPTFIDEVYFADPVINFLQGRGYTTTVWNVTGPLETHVSTAPAYSLLLLVWFKMVGIAQTPGRVLAAVLALCSALVFWRACVRAGLIKSAVGGAMVICVVLMDYGFAFSYTCARPDSLSSLLMAAMFYSSTLQNRRIALCAICAIALALPFFQWGCVIYLLLMSVALLFIARKETLRYLVAVWVCVIVGLLVQKAVYTHFGVWETWLNTIRSEGSESILKRIGFRMTWDALLHHHTNTIPKDFSVLMVLAGMALIYVRCRLLRMRDGAQLAKAAWIIAVIVTAGMYCAGKFPTYYGWMLGFPLAVLLASCFEKAVAADRAGAAITAAIAVVACGVGLPLQAGLASHDWKERNPAAISAWLAPKITPNDVVYCDYPFYFIAKARAKTVVAGRHFGLLTADDFNHLTLAIVGKNGSDWQPSTDVLTHATAIWSWKPARSGLLGNNWEYGVLSAPNYNCAVYRLRETDEPAAAPIPPEPTPPR